MAELGGGEERGEGGDEELEGEERGGERREAEDSVGRSLDLGQVFAAIRVLMEERVEVDEEYDPLGRRETGIHRFR